MRKSFFAFPCLPINCMLVCCYACHATCSVFFFFFVHYVLVFFFHCKPITKLSGSWSEGHLSTVKLFQPIGSDSVRLKSKNSIVKLNTNRDHHKSNIFSVLPHGRPSLLSLVGKQEKKQTKKKHQVIVKYPHVHIKVEIVNSPLKPKNETPRGRVGKGCLFVCWLFFFFFSWGSCSFSIINCWLFSLSDAANHSELRELGDEWGRKTIKEMKIK